MKSKNLSENILRSVKSKGYKYINLPSVIEADHIVQRSGENFRKFIFSFHDQDGTELCLRPDLTIASCLRYLDNNLKDAHYQDFSANLILGNTDFNIKYLEESSHIGSSSYVKSDIKIDFDNSTKLSFDLRKNLVMTLGQRICI